MAGYQLALEEYRQSYPLTAKVADTDKPDIAKLAWYAIIRKITKETNRLDATPAKTQIADLADQFIAEERRRCQTGQTTLKTVWECTKNVKAFVTHTRNLGKLNANQIDAEVMSSYQTLILFDSRKAEGGKMSLATAKKRLRWAKKFVIWLDENEKIERRPRNLGSRYAHVSLPKPTPRHFTVEELQSIFKASPRRTKLYTLLALNGGYTQTDISNLRHEHIDWESGVIRRWRQKTEKRSGVEQVFKMWPSTRKLLQEEMTHPSAGFVLLGEDGKQLERQEETADGKPKCFDAIRSAFNRAMVRAGLDRRGEDGKWKRDKRRFAILRKTGANEIGKLYPHAKDMLERQYLAHARRGAVTHYTEDHRSLIDEAIEKLETIFNLTV